MMRTTCLGARSVPCRRPTIALLVMACGLFVGCGERRYPVSGTITYGDGTPYTGGGAVALEKGSGKDQVMVRAVINDDGTFSTCPPPADPPAPGPASIACD